MANPLTHSKVPKHTVLTKGQASLMMRTHHVDDIETMPRIFFSDPVLARMRADGQSMQVGDIIQIDRDNLSLGTERTWRVIVDE